MSQYLDSSSLQEPAKSSGRPQTPLVKPPVGPEQPTPALPQPNKLGVLPKIATHQVCSNPDGLMPRFLKHVTVDIPILSFFSRLAISVF
jgi:hypothetical protein